MRQDRMWGSSCQALDAGWRGCCAAGYRRNSADRSALSAQCDRCADGVGFYVVLHYAAPDSPVPGEGTLAGAAVTEPQARARAISIAGLQARICRRSSPSASLSCVRAQRCSRMASMRAASQNSSGATARSSAIAPTVVAAMIRPAVPWPASTAEMSEALAAPPASVVNACLVTEFLRRLEAVWRHGQRDPRISPGNREDFFRGFSQAGRS